ncbi:MAG TPA: phosphopantetheine-binding protein, partial [Longimicrobiaceae bacterium]|nr:phosphopantetheine-binding protein [Longimicrobiaceae bacterium]
RRVLPAPEVGSEAAYVAPRTPVEEVLAGIWSELLGVERIGIHDDFFRLGGHSLLSIQLVTRIREVLGMEVPLRSVVQVPTVAGVAGLMDTGERPPPRLSGRSPSAWTPVLAEIRRTSSSSDGVAPRVRVSRAEHHVVRVTVGGESEARSGTSLAPKCPDY